MKKKQLVRNILCLKYYPKCLTSKQPTSVRKRRDNSVITIMGNYVNPTPRVLICIANVLACDTMTEGTYGQLVLIHSYIRSQRITALTESLVTLTPVKVTFVSCHRSRERGLLSTANGSGLQTTVMIMPRHSLWRLSLWHLSQNISSKLQKLA